MLAVFILNSTMRGKEVFLKTLEQTASQFPEIRIKFYETKYHNHAHELAAEALQAQADYIIAVGGDGTLNQVINGVLHADSKHQIVFGLIPKGSGNDYARSLNTTNNLNAFFQVMQAKQTTRVDVGKALYKDETGKDQTRYFLNIADVGMGADVVKRVNTSNKKLGPQLIFMKSIVQTFLSFKHKNLNVIADEWQWKGDAMTVVIAKGKYFGGGLGIAPDANLSDGLFQVTLLGKVSVWDYIMHLPGLKKSKHINHKQVKYLNTKSISISCRDSLCGLEADGEFFGYLPAKIDLLKSHVTFLSTSHSASR